MSDRPDLLDNSSQANRSSLDDFPLVILRVHKLFDEANQQTFKYEINPHVEYHIIDKFQNTQYEILGVLVIGLIQL